MKKFILLLCAVTVWSAMQAQSEVPFNGLITRADGKGVKAVFQIKGTNLYARSDKNGRFGFINLQPTDTLIVKCAGEKRQIAVGDKKSLRITWVDDSDVLAVADDELLTSYGLGYIKQREYMLSGSVITGDELRRYCSTTLKDVLASRVTGVSVTSDGKVKIRNNSSINATTYALILVDGNEVQSLDAVSLYDVGTVEVLKEAPLYGFRGANGVVLIKTRAALTR